MTKEPDFHALLLNSFFPDGIPPHQYGNLAVLMLYIGELYDLHYQVSRTEKDNGGEARQEIAQVATKQPQNGPEAPSKPYISETYPANFEDAPVQPKTEKKKMGRPPRVPGSLGPTCPNCGSSDVVAGGFGPNKERRIRCKACGSQPTVSSSPEKVQDSTKRAENVSERPHFSNRIDERILELEFEDLTPEEISERLKAEGAIISAAAIKIRLEELNATPGEASDGDNLL